MADFFKILRFIANYIYVIVNEYSSWMEQQIVCTLPSYMYPQYSEFVIQPEEVDSDDSDDSDAESRTPIEIVVFYAFLTMVALDEVYDERLSSTQLLSFTDVYGRIKFNDLLRAYPNAIALNIDYFKKRDGTYEMVTQEIGLLTREDIRTGKKCKFGRIQL